MDPVLKSADSVQSCGSSRQGIIQGDEDRVWHQCNHKTLHIYGKLLRRADHLKAVAVE